MANRWIVKKLVNHPRYPQEWGVFDGAVLHDTCPTLKDAHTYATQLAVADVLFNPGGLTALRELKCR